MSLTFVSAWLTVASIGCGGSDRPTQDEQTPARDIGPSLEQTRAWVAERLPDLAGHYVAYLPFGRYIAPGGVQTRILSAALDSSCTLRIELESLSRTVEFGESRQRLVYRVPLAEVDLNSVHVERMESTPGGTYSLEPYHSVFLSVTGRRDLVIDSVVASDGVEDTTRAELGLGAKDENAAGRIANALRRAVKLCGGLKEAF